VPRLLEAPRRVLLFRPVHTKEDIPVWSNVKNIQSIFMFFETVRVLQRIWQFKGMDSAQAELAGTALEQLCSRKMSLENCK
jgi:hypothetical protein